MPSKKARRQTPPRNDVGCWNYSKVTDWVALRLVKDIHASLLKRSRCAAQCSESVTQCMLQLEVNTGPVTGSMAYQLRRQYTDSKFSEPVDKS
jgi:hypothetical protein